MPINKIIYSVLIFLIIFFVGYPLLTFGIGATFTSLGYQLAFDRNNDNVCSTTSLSPGTVFGCMGIGAALLAMILIPFIVIFYLVRKCIYRSRDFQLDGATLELGSEPSTPVPYQNSDSSY